jgi:uncharacterized protein (DUF58 family)
MEEHCLSRANLYMLPTRHGILFSIVLLAMLLISVNYNNSLAYIMTFTLASTVLISMLYTHRNLEGLCLSYGTCSAVYAGDMLSYTLILSNRSKRDRYDIGIDIKDDQSRRMDVPASDILNIECSTRVRKRGWYSLPGAQVNTRYPLGLLFSWSRPTGLDRKTLVFPEPAEWQDFPSRYSGNSPKPVLRKTSHDDYSGLRIFRKGDSPQHIDWKAYARGKGLYCKEFVGGEMPEMTFHWDDTYGDREHRISLLTRWVIEAGAQGISFGLDLPGQKLLPANDERHMSECLKVLALF